MTTPYYNASSGPVTVVGTDVHYDDVNSPQLDYKREKQPNQFRDLIWGVLFYAHLIVVIVCAAIYIPQTISSLAEDYAGDGNHNGERRLLVRLRFLEDEDNQNNNWNYHSSADNNDVSLDITRCITVVALTGVTGLLVSTMALGFMILFAETLISVSIIGTIVLTLLSGFGALLMGQIPGAIMGLVMAGLLTFYACRIWSRIPFAATNLVTATTAVKQNLGVAFYAYFNLLLSFGWAILWTASAISTLYILGDCEGDGTCNNDVSGVIVFLFIVSYYWTIQVIGNVVAVTVAGVTGTWWFSPLEAAACCSRAVTDSYYRAMTYSFGSIALGSLVVALISAAKEMVGQLRESDDGLMVCLAECLISCVERLVEYFNEWAFAFVGLYGFSFVEASIEVMNLFRSRGWTAIITDDLASRALLVLSFFVGLINGIVGILLGSTIGMGDGVPGLIPFMIGLLTGLTLCTTLFSVVGSACKSVIVLYAEAPNEFQANHPQLSERMRMSWRQAWPTEFKY